MSTTVVIKHRFAVWLEDAIEVEVPDGVTDVNEWAIENYEALFCAACEHPAGSRHLPRLLWEDEHKADLDFPEAEIFIEHAHTETR